MLEWAKKPKLAQARRFRPSPYTRESGQEPKKKKLRPTIFKKINL